MVRPPEFVENFMISPVYKIDEKDTIQKAQKSMESNRTEFLIVTRNDMPVGILEDWRTWDVEKNKTIEYIRDKLLPVSTFRKDTPIQRVTQQLRGKTAVVIDDDDKIVGIVRARELV